jgi:hypothetical protein
LLKGHTGFMSAYAVNRPAVSDRACYRAAMGIPLSESALRLVDGKNYAVLAEVRHFQEAGGML